MAATALRSPFDALTCTCTCWLALDKVFEAFTHGCKILQASERLAECEIHAEICFLGAKMYKSLEIYKWNKRIKDY